MKRLVKKIQYMLWDRPIGFIYSRYYWIKTSLEYAWFLRHDNDFDHSSILYLLKYKLSRMRKYLKEENIVLKTDEICSQIYHAECLIQKLIDDEFGQELYKEHNKKWNVEFFKGKLFKSSNAKTQAEKALEANEFRVIMDQMHKEKQQCKRELFDHLNDYIEEWWS